MATRSPEMLSSYLLTSLFYFFLHLFVCDTPCLFSSALGFELSFCKNPSTRICSWFLPVTAVDVLMPAVTQAFLLDLLYAKWVFEHVVVDMGSISFCSCLRVFGNLTQKQMPDLLQRVRYREALLRTLCQFPAWIWTDCCCFFLHKKPPSPPAHPFFTHSSPSQQGRACGQHSRSGVAAGGQIS